MTPLQKCFIKSAKNEIRNTTLTYNITPNLAAETSLGAGGNMLNQLGAYEGSILGKYIGLTAGIPLAKDYLVSIGDDLHEAYTNSGSNTWNKLRDNALAGARGKTTAGKTVDLLTDTRFGRFRRMLNMLPATTKTNSLKAMGILGGMSALGYTLGGTAGHYIGGMGSDLD